MQFLAKHKWAILTAVLIGVIIGLPHSYFVWKNHDVYQGFYLGGIDEDFYLARVREIRDGHFTLANALWAEGKNLPSPWPPGSEIIISLTGQIFGLDVINTVLFEKFIFSALVFLLIYFLAYKLSGDKLAGILAGAVVLLSSNLTGPRALWDLLIHQETSKNFLVYTRMNSPQVHAIFFFGFFLSFCLFFFSLRKKRWLLGALSGFIFGLSFYVYPYTWTFIGAFLGCLGLVFLFRKNWAGIKNIILIGGVGFLVAIPYFLNLWQAMQYSSYSDMSVRFGVMTSQAPQLGLTILIVLAAFLLFFPRAKKKRFDFSLAILLAPFVVLNQHLLTGRLLTSAHYHYHYHKPLAIIFLIIIIFAQLKRIKKDAWRRLIKGTLSLAIFLIIFYNALTIQASSYQFHKADALERQRYGPVFEWFEQKAKKDEVVLANFEFSDFIPIYTSLNSVSAMDAHYYLGADEEQLLERMFIQYRLDELGGEQAKDFFFQNREEVSKKIYGQFYRKTEGGYDKIPDEKLIEFADKYQKFLAIPFERILQKFQTDYLIWDTISQPDWAPGQYGFLKLIFEKNGLKIYQIANL